MAVFVVSLGILAVDLAPFNEMAVRVNVWILRVDLRLHKVILAVLGF